MKLNRIDWLRRDQGDLIATFGQARLVKDTRNNRFELIGGTPADHAQAREWVSLFCHEVVLSSLQNGSAGLGNVRQVTGVNGESRPNMGASRPSDSLSCVER